MISLRTRIRIGAVLWMFGIVWWFGAIFSVLIEHFPEAMHYTRVHGFIRGRLMLPVAALSLIVGTMYVRRGLQRLDALRTGLATLDRSSSRRLEGEFPPEIQPLVDDLNTLLDAREQAIARAVAKAGDLAHGLKTPLAILAQDIDRAESAGQADLAASIRQQVTRMRRQVDYHLAQARATATGTSTAARTSVLDSAEGLRRAMLRLFAGRGIEIALSVPAETSVRVPREDLDEMLGNLVENGCKWARSRVVVAVEAGPIASDRPTAVITVDDDGSGIPEEMRDAVLQRGVRADEAAPGTGLGLAIVRDLAALYGGSIALAASPLGGLRATLRLPAVER
jgi:signal transduction histidine kinase